MFGACLLWLLLPGAAAAPERPSLRLGVSASGPPLAFFDQGVLRGLAVELAQALAEALDQELQVQEMPEARLANALRGGRIDLMISTLPQTDLDALGLAASAALFQSGQMALIRAADIGRFRRSVDIITTSARVGYQQGTAGARFVQSRMPTAQQVPFADVIDGIAALRQGDIDLFIHDAPTIWAVATDAAEEQLLGMFQPLSQARAAWTVRAEDQRLLSDIDRVVQQWRDSGRLSRMVNRWMPVRIEVAD
ncbi:MAG: transporter substrate-binding domain-containing protein [Thiohalocapsa sp.]|uniref:substrate-binding periplasmic protein n=1 Tax=Thiohalocapsa sp. TaxID=2497641 RepID=UPI0025E3B934|nr:transporter substrate-binding domain-containing protein [Thiohalocapsa sp.]MCG6941016.1 transporter substrate-binding domain-containing protein [Thiohalocapsa sp.]